MQQLIKFLGAVTSYSEQTIPDTIYFPAYSISPEEIFQGKILLFNVDFFGEPKTIKEATKEQTDSSGNVIKDENGVPQKAVQFYYYEDKNGEDLDTDGNGEIDTKGFKTSKQDMGAQLSSTISRWYVAIRNIALVAMMIVLLYIGIRMLLSTLSSDKAKYRQMLQDWLIGVVLLFFMHYIMAFSVTLVQRLTDVISSSVDKQAYFALIPFSEDTGKADKLKDFIDEAGLQDYYVDENKQQSDRDNAAAVLYPTNLLGYLRLDVQLAQFGTSYIGKAICFTVLVLMTVFFVFTYLRRVLYMAFLTLMAPLVAVTYPIDKISDGSAQGFNKWIKEYIFNLLIQPLHLLLYYILVTSAFDLAGENVLYSIVAIGFMIPAEKLLRSFFGFQKSETAGAFTGAAGGALAMAGINKLGSGLKKALGGSGSSKGGSSGSGSDSSDSENNSIKMAGGADRTQALLDDENSQGSKNKDAETDNTAEALASGATIGAIAATTTSTDSEDKNQEQQEANNDNIRLANNQQEDMDTNTLQATDTENEKESKLKASRPYRIAARQVGAIRAGIADRGRKSKREIQNKIKKFPGNAVRFTGKAITRGAAGLAVGSVLAAGAAVATIGTGDPSKVASYMAGAGAAGFIATNGVGKNAKLIDEKAYNQAYNDPKYDDLLLKTKLRDFKAENKGTIQRTFGEEKAKEILKKGGLAEQAINSDVSDIDEVVAMQQMIDVGEVKSTKAAIAVAQTHQKLQDYSKAEQDKFWDKEVKAFEDKGQVHEEAVKSKDQAKGKVDKFDKFKKGFRK